MQTIVITDKPENWAFLNSIVPIVDASQYLSDDAYHSNASIRVINLCQSYQYQTIGYYVSLLAQARDHKAIPSILNIQDVLNTSLSKLISHEIDEEIQHGLETIKASEFVLSLYFGQNMAKKYASLAKKLHGLFPLPLLRFTLERKKNWSIKKLSVLSIADVPEHHLEFMQQAAENYVSKNRFHQRRTKQRFHDLAILVDSNETHPPSNSRALNYFANAGEALGVNIDFIDKHDQKSIAEYDALFIRATTAVDHYTYQFSRRAAQNNLVVMDDPQSIVKCSNKVYLAELMRAHQILTPKTMFISKYDVTLPSIDYPCVIKKPDGAFSQGVVKLNNKDDLQKSLKQFFKSSDLVLIQPFIPTEFDWRIGILDNKPLYASRYYMAKDHWQIYNWQSTHNIQGSDESVALNKVPEGIIKTALKASRLIGNSLYGVDIKSINDKHYVMEINDNPNIDAGIEDQVLGDALYHQIMTVFLQRIRRNHGYDS
jgi:glutathione synthase/RimK-type ligase-like ATP-grasp enzyme